MKPATEFVHIVQSPHLVGLGNVDTTYQMTIPRVSGLLEQVKGYEGDLVCVSCTD